MPKEQIASPGGMNKLQNDITALNGNLYNRNAVSLGTVSSITDLNTALETQYSTMTNGETRSVKFITSNLSGWEDADYVGTIIRTNVSRCSVMVGCAYQETHIGSRNPGTGWTWDKLALNSNIAMFSPSAYTQPTNLDSNATVSSGGYVKAGKLVVVCCRISVSSNISAGTQIAKFPTYSGNTAFVSVTNNKKLDMTISDAGKLSSSETVTSGTLVISCVYFAI